MNHDLDQIAQALFDNKGFNILALDVRGICTIADYFIIAEGTVNRHVKALANAVSDMMDRKPLHVEGGADGDWVVLDYGVILIHLFIPELREKYALENVWREGKVVDLNIDVGKVNHG